MRSHSKIMLIGAGHAHLHVIRRGALLNRLGLDWCVVDPGTFWYSGMATGMLGGHYSLGEDQIDVEKLVTGCGGRFLRDRMVQLLPNQCRVVLAGGQSLPYDYVSLNVGSEVVTDRVETSGGLTIKPIANLWSLREQLEHHFAEGGKVLRIVVVGGGPAGCEIAANLEDLARRHQALLKITLLSHSPRLIPQAPQGASDRLLLALQRRAITVECSVQVKKADPHLVQTADGRRFPCDHLVLATGLGAPLVIRNLPLPTDGHQGLRVDSTLRSVADNRVFGVGDCIHLKNHPLPRLGVFGVRQGPILLHNLIASAQGEPMKSYYPQTRYLSILNLGRGEGLATWGKLFWKGRFSLWWKDWLDRRFMRRSRGES